jgi:tetratricopeptide (TPR) repeat protein
VHWKRGEFPKAAHWLTRYHDTSVALVKLDPLRPEWQSELAHGKHNLAVLQVDQNNFPAARTGFIEELESLEKLRESQPSDVDLRARIADAHSWLGGLAVRNGEFSAALDQYRAETTQFALLAAAEPDTPRWRFELANARLTQVDTLLATGQLDAAVEQLEEADRLLQDLVSHDRANRDWSSAAANVRLNQARVARAQNDEDTARRLLASVRPQLEQASAAESSDRSLLRRLATAWRLEAEWRSTDKLKGAAEAASRAIELGDQLYREARTTDVELGELALATIAAGEIASRAGDRTAAMKHAQRAAEVLAPRLSNTRDWRLLDPAARVAVLTGRTDEARALIAQLNKMGYVPLTPWPALPMRSASDPTLQLEPKPK